LIENSDRGTEYGERSLDGPVNLDSLAAHLPEIVARFDSELRHLYVSPAITRVTGLLPEQIIGRTNKEIGFSSELVEQWNGALRRVFDTGYQEELAFHFDGPSGKRELVTLLVPEQGPDGRTRSVIGVTRDVTEHQSLERQLEDSRARLRNLAVHLLRAREDERKKVAREIHDELGQILAALKMDLRWVERKMGPSAPDVVAKIHGAVELADQMIELVHRIASELRPGVLDDLGLTAAIEWLGSDFSRRSGIPCRTDVTAPEERIGGNASIVIFRIIQEALANVARHSGAAQASVEFWEADNVLHVRIRDDGRGLTEAQAASPLSLGLIGIRERAEGLGGRVTVTGQAGQGTNLEVSIPLPSHGALA